MGGHSGPAIVVTPAPPPARPVGPPWNNADDHRRGYARARCRPADPHTPGTDRHLSDTPDASARDGARRPAVSTRAPRRVRVCGDEALTDPPSASAEGNAVARPSVPPGGGVRSGAHVHPATAATLFVPWPPCVRPTGRDSAADHTARGARRTMGAARCVASVDGTSQPHLHPPSMRVHEPTSPERHSARGRGLDHAVRSAQRTACRKPRLTPAPRPARDGPPTCCATLARGLVGDRAMQASLAGGLSGCHHTGDTDRPSGGRSVRRTESHRPWHRTHDEALPVTRRSPTATALS